MDAEVAELTAQIALDRPGASPDARTPDDHPAVGEVVADAFLARLPDLATFKTGRDLAAFGWDSPGSTSPPAARLRTSGPISKKGDKALRRLLVAPGATAVIARQQCATSASIPGSRRQRHQEAPSFRVAAVALAAKTARIIWAILAHGGTYQEADYRPTLATA